jgi:hypothetical protein
MRVAVWTAKGGRLRGSDFHSQKRLNERNFGTEKPATRIRSRIRSEILLNTELLSRFVQNFSHLGAFGRQKKRITLYLICVHAQH